MSLWLILTIFYVATVIKESKNKTPRQRLNQIWVGTKLVLWLPVMITLLISLVVIIYYTLQLPIENPMVEPVLLVFGVATSIYITMFFWEINCKYLKQIKEATI